MDDLLTARSSNRAARQPGFDRSHASGDQASEVSFGPRAAIGMSIWYGLVIGLAELGLTIALKPLRDPSPGFFRMNRHIVWTIPTVSLVLFGLCGLLAALVLRFRPQWAVRFTTGLFSGLAVLILLLTIQRLYSWACMILACGLACRLAVRLEMHLAPFRRLIRRSLPVLAVAVFGLVSVSLGGHILRERWAMELLLPVSSNAPDAPNVLLIVLDTVRADRLSLYGYDRDTTPNLSRLARRGVKFEQARSTAPWTLPSHCTMLTGLYPHQISAGLHGPLDQTQATLAEFLAANGYATGGFVANTTYCGAETGLNRGFAHYEDHDLSPWGILCSTAIGKRVLSHAVGFVYAPLGESRKSDLRKDAARINRDMLAWIDQQGDRPFFAFANYFDVHNPYMPPSTFTRHFGVIPKSSEDFTTLDRWFILDKKTLAPRDIQLVNDAYDDCIASLDEQLGRLFDDLEKRGRLDNTLVIVTADHGEHFGEHELYGHASSLYDQEIHVPLLALLPRRAHAGRSVADPVSLRDLPATVTSLLGLGGTSPFPGDSLARYLDSSTRPAEGPSLSEVDAPVKAAPNQGRSPVFRGPMKALTFGNEVYIRNGDGVEEVFDVEADPLQTRNLVSSPAVQTKLKEYRETLDRMTRDDTRPAEWRGIVAKLPPTTDHQKSLVPSSDLKEASHP
ncbi:sulfatase [Singulisphaera sp. Ch08]|uniref:Sulfatase n=1 Tax=Singulisphaera sp. Ch08 TaxID=3120278 RepID=A0AAU7C9I1_9BACT